MNDDTVGRIDKDVIVLGSKKGRPPLRLLRNKDPYDPGSTCADCGATHSESIADIYHAKGCPSEWRNVR